MTEDMRERALNMCDKHTVQFFAGENCDICRMQAALSSAGTSGTECKARKQIGDIGPQDCDWPFCGCDPKADKVIEGIEESGFKIVRGDSLSGKGEATKEEKFVSTDEKQIKHMVERFLQWKLPENFNPDGGISFKKMFNEHTDHPMKHEPVGTNLLDYTQADQMVRYIVDGLPSASAPDRAEELARRVATQLVCRHEHTQGGNDYIRCQDCELEWDYRHRDPLIALKAFGTDVASILRREMGRETLEGR